MDSVTNRYISTQLPFQGLTDYDVEVNFRSAREHIIELMNQHDLVDFLKNNYLAELFDPRDLVSCNYHDETEFVKLDRDSENDFNVISMNIRSVPKHYGELFCLLSVLETRFDVIILTEIGARNITTVQCIMDNYLFYFTVRKRPISVKIDNFFSRVTLKFNGWPWKTIGHLSSATSCFMHHFITIYEFKL